MKNNVFLIVRYLWFVNSNIYWCITSISPWCTPIHGIFMKLHSIWLSCPSGNHASCHQPFCLSHTSHMPAHHITYLSLCLDQGYPLLCVSAWSSQGSTSISWGFCNIGCPSKIHLKPKSHEISFAHNLLLSYPIVLKFCTEDGSITALLLCEECQNDAISPMDVTDEWDLARFAFKMSFGQICYIAQPPGYICNACYVEKPAPPSFLHPFCWWFLL